MVKFTKEDLELARAMPSFEDRQRFLLLIVEATVENRPVRREYLRAVELNERRIEELGYKGPYLDVAAYAEAYFQWEDEQAATHPSNEDDGDKEGPA